MITEINGKTIERMSDVAPFIHNSGETGEPLNLVLLRDGKYIRTKLTPQKDNGESSYRIGLYIRDSADWNWNDDICSSRFYEIWGTWSCYF